MVPQSTFPERVFHHDVINAEMMMVKPMAHAQRWGRCACAGQLSGVQSWDASRGEWENRHGAMHQDAARMRRKSVDFMFFMGGIMGGCRNLCLPMF